MSKADADPQVQRWLGQMNQERCSSQAALRSRRLKYRCYLDLSKLNFNRAPVWRRWQPHRRLFRRLPSSWPVPAPCPQILFHASHTSQKARQKPHQQSCGFGILCRQSSWNERDKSKAELCSTQNYEAAARRSAKWNGFSEREFPARRWSTGTTKKRASRKICFISYVLFIRSKNNSISAQADTKLELQQHSCLNSRSHNSCAMTSKHLYPCLSVYERLFIWLLSSTYY